MARARESKKRNWSTIGTLVASAAISGGLSAPVHAQQHSPADLLRDALDPGRAQGAPWDTPQAIIEAIHRLRFGPAASGAVRMPAASDAIAAPGQDTSIRQFNIPAGPLDEAITTFERVTGITINRSKELTGNLRSPGVSGARTSDAALRELLTGTNLIFRFTASNEVALDIHVDVASVDVTAQAPVVIASPKYTEPLHDVPQSVEVISRAVIDQQGVTTLSDALRNVPGISLQAGEGGGASRTAGDMFNLRGFSANNSLFVDGVRDDGLISRDVYDLEQVDVFFGPTGSDVGRGTAAGYVNMESKTPHPGSAYDAQFGYGDADQKRLTLDVNHPLSLGSANSWFNHGAFRLNGLWQDGGVPGRDVVELKRQSIAPSFALGLGTPTRLVAAAEITRENNIPDYGIPGSAWSGSQLAPTTVIAAQPVNQQNYYGSAGYDYDHANQENVTLRGEHDVNSHLTFRDQVRYNDTHRTAVITAIQNPAAFAPDTGLVTLSRQGSEQVNRIGSNQVTAVARFATGGLRHAATIGTEYTFESQFTPTLTGLGTRAPVNIYSPNPSNPVTGYSPARSSAYNRGRTDTVALYGFDTINLGDRWQASGGVRWEHYRTHYQVVDATNTTTTDAQAADGLFSGKAGLLYKISDQGNVYFSYGTSSTPPGTSNFTLSSQTGNQNNPDVKPQVSTNYEVGSKWQVLHDRLAIDTAVFHTTNKNVIYTVDATAIPPVYNQDDGQKLNGVSVGVSGHISSRWDVSGSVSYLATELVTQNVANAGHQLTLTPPFSGNVWTTYRIGYRLTIGGGIRHTDAVFVNTANNIITPGYHVVDALAQYEVNEHFTLRVNLANVTNDRYVQNVNNNGGRYNPGTPRAAMVTSGITF